MNYLFEITTTFIENLVLSFTLFLILIKYFKPRDYILIFGISFVSTILVILINTIDLVSPFTFVFTCIIFSTTIFILLKENPFITFSISITYFVAISTIEMFLICIMSIITNNPNIINKIISPNDFARIIFGVISKSMDIIILLLLKNKLKKLNKDLFKSILYAICTFVFLFIIIRMMQLMLINDASSLKQGLALMFVVYIFLFGLNLILNNRIYENKQKIREQQNLEINNLVLSSALNNINSLYVTNSKKFHDFKHHINYISDLCSTENISEIKNYIEQIATTETKNYYSTGNKIIDFVLNSKYEFIEDNNIEFDFSQKNFSDVTIASSDLCSLLLNLFDNALNATIQTNKRYVTLKLEKQGNLIFIRISNTYDSNKSKHKTIDFNHGWGKKIISDIVSKYNGEEYIETKDDIYNVKILLIEG